MRDSNLKVLFRRCCLVAPTWEVDSDFCLVVLSHDATSSNARGQTNNIAKRVTLVPAATCRTPYYAHFDINLASSQFTSVALSVLTHKNSRIVC